MGIEAEKKFIVKLTPAQLRVYEAYKESSLMIWLHAGKLIIQGTDPDRAAADQMLKGEIFKEKHPKKSWRKGYFKGKKHF